MKRNMGLVLAALLGSTPALAAENNWDSYIAAQLSPNRVVAKTAAGTIDRHARDITMVLVEARKHWDELSPETQTLARRWMARPDSGGDSTPFGTVIIDPAHRTNTNTTHFRIHWVNCASYGGDDNCASASYISSVKTALEKVYTKEITTLGYTAPPSDAAIVPDNGGNGLYDVYVAEIGSMGIYGYASPESSATSSPSYLVIDNDYNGFGYSDPTVPMKVTVAHEYFHSVQFGYDSNENSAFMENSSTWMETQVYPTIHDNYQYLGEPYKDENGNGHYDRGELFTDRNGNGTRDEGSLDFPEAPLDTFNNDLLQYGRWLWPQHLTEEYGAGMMQDIWDACAGTAGENHLTAMNSALIAGGVGSGLAGVYQNYAIKGYDTLQYADGANYPRVWVDGVANGRANLRSATTYSLGGGSQRHLSTVYERINNPSGNYTFTTAGGTPALNIIEVGSDCAVIGDGSVAIAAGTGTWSPGAGTAFAIAVISNVSRTANDMTWSLTGGTADTSSVPACGIAVKNGVREGNRDSGGGGGALDLLALSIAGLFYARRRLA